MSAIGTLTGRALKACFVISPMGSNTGETRRRADYVLENVIKPACLIAGYDAKRSDELDDPDVARGIRDSLLGSPMAVAYLGSRFNCSATTNPCMTSSLWNDSVMVEVGYRLAAGLPLVLVCDDLPGGGNLNLPAALGIMRTVMIPQGKDELDPEKPADKARLDSIVKDLARRIHSMEADGPICSEHAVALVHTRKGEGCDPSDPANMFYVAASRLATELFGFEDAGTKGVRLAGQTMDKFLDILKYRMPRRQYEEFLESQHQARSTWTDKGNEEESWRTPSVHIPIVFDRHPHNPQFIGRAYLPLIVNNFDAGRSWSTLRVIYMDVTSVTQAHKVGDDTVYTCEIDPRSNPIKLLAAAEPLHVFLCHNSKDKPVVETILHRVAELSPLSVHPWVDKTDIVGGQSFVDQIGSIVRKADVALVFLGKNGVGPFQEREIATLVKHVTDPARKKLVILPVLLDDIDPDDVKTPDCWEMLAPENYAQIADVDSDGYLIRFFDTHFPNRLIL